VGEEENEEGGKEKGGTYGTGEIFPGHKPCIVPGGTVGPRSRPPHQTSTNIWPPLRKQA